MITYGYLQTAFAVLQLLGGPVYGRLGDMFGSRAVLVIAHSCGFLTYLLIAMANSSTALFFSRVPGLLMHGAQGKFTSCISCSFPIVGTLSPYAIHILLYITIHNTNYDL